MSDEMDHVRAKLAARRTACLDRLEDAVAELFSLHCLNASAIHAIVDEVIAVEEGEART